MKVVIVTSGTTIAPFDLSVDDCPCGAETFGSYRTRTLTALGLHEVSRQANAHLVVGPALVIADDVWVTRKALQVFLKQLRTDTPTEPVRLALPKSRLLEVSIQLQDVDIDNDGVAAFDVAYVPAGRSIEPRQLFAQAKWLPLQFRELLMETPIPHLILETALPVMTFPLTSMVVMRLRHWLHLLRASHLAPPVLLAERARSQPIRTALRLLLGLRLGKARRMDGWKKNFNYIHPTAYVHPTAHVEASIIGAGCTIGPHAMVSQSVLGDDVRVEQRAHVQQCVVGARAFISLNSSMVGSLAFADSNPCGNNVQACVMGPRSAVTSLARPLDLQPGGPVYVRDGDRLRAVGELPCGVCFGPDSFVGAGVMIAAGRVVPAGVRVFANPGQLLRRVHPEVPGGVYVVDEGELAMAPTLPSTPIPTRLS
jgi:acetyltransferase-like isoleucine patch superfamily enzyme